jgi:hypothetical protein
MTRISGLLETKAMATTFGRCLLAALPIGLVGWLGQHWLAGLGREHVLIRAIALLLVISSATLLFLLSSWALKIEGFQEFLGIVSRKLKGRVKS